MASSEPELPAAMKLSDIRPYQSIVVVETSVDRSVHDWLDELADALSIGTRVERDNGAEPSLAFTHYKVRARVPWSTSLHEIRHHLLAVVQYERLLGIFASEGKMRGALSTKLRGDELPGITAVSPARLEAALVKGDAKLMWLKRVHRQDDWRVDAQLLTARNVAATLDPLAHQSYRYSGVRISAEKGSALGVALDDARVWRSQSKTGKVFLDAVTDILVRVDKRKRSSKSPFPVLAQARATLTGVRKATEAILSLPELEIAAGQPDPDDATALTIEDLVFHTVLQVTPKTGAEFEVDAVCDGNPLGTLAIKPAATGGRIKLGVSTVKQDDPRLDAVKAWAGRSGALTVHYESGHTLVNGQVAEMRYRDVVLDGSNWHWANFAPTFDVGKEKPAKFDAKETDRRAAIEDPKDTSLFRWSLLHLRSALGGSDSSGWLMCDDRALETCDFLYLDDSPDRPELTLVHIKAADRTKLSGSKKSGVNPNRGVSLHPFELVVSQAIKNLRNLDAVLQGQTLSSVKMYMKTPTGGTADRRPVWKGNAPSTVGAFTARVEELQSRLNRRVVILQPHQRKTKTLTEPTTKNELLMFRQLQTLLVAARSTCASLGAKFIVIGEDS